MWFITDVIEKTHVITQTKSKCSLEERTLLRATPTPPFHPALALSAKVSNGLRVNWPSWRAKAVGSRRVLGR